MKFKKFKADKLHQHEIDLIYEFLEDKLFQQRIEEEKLKIKKNLVKPPKHVCNAKTVEKSYDTHVMQYPISILQENSQENAKKCRHRAVANLNFVNTSKKLPEDHLNKPDQSESIQRELQVNKYDCCGNQDFYKYESIDEKVNKLLNNNFSYEKLTETFCNLKIKENESNLYPFDYKIDGEYKFVDSNYSYHFTV